MLNLYREKNGMTVKGNTGYRQRGRPISPLLGRGFERSEDGLTYKATISGKIEMQNNRILIVPIYEIFWGCRCKHWKY